MKYRTHPLCRSALCLSAFLVASTAICFPAYAEFNPAEGAEPARSVNPVTLPSIDPLLGPGRHTSQSQLFPSVRPSAAAQSAPVAIPFSPAQAKPAISAIGAPAIPPLQPVMPVVFPRMDAQALQAGGFVPPAPLIAAPVTTPEAVAVNPPAIVTPPVPQASVTPPVAVVPVPVPVLAEAPAAPLSRDTKTVLSHIPSKIDAAKPGKGGKVAINRTTAEMHDLQLKGKVEEYEASGIKISVRRPGLDTNYELNRAFTAVSGGDSQTAMDIYKNVLSAEPTNADALFGLASLYHRQGQLDKARSYYATLLKHYPTHRDGLNNFLVLVSEESPQEALAELERLEQRNPDFSPIPAQQSLLLNKLGYVPEARNKMLRAIELAPDNLTYKYNLAVMLDSQGDVEGAVSLYRMLLTAQSRGETLPAPVETIQKRLNFLVTSTLSAQPPANR